MPENKVKVGLKVAPVHHPAEPTTTDESTFEAKSLTIESFRAHYAEVTVLAIWVLLRGLEAHNGYTAKIRLMVVVDKPLEFIVELATKVESIEPYLPHHPNDRDRVLFVSEDLEAYIPEHQWPGVLRDHMQFELSGILDELRSIPLEEVEPTTEIPAPFLE